MTFALINSIEITILFLSLLRNLTLTKSSELLWSLLIKLLATFTITKKSFLQHSHLLIPMAYQSPGFFLSFPKTVFYHLMH